MTVPADAAARTAAAGIAELGAEARRAHAGYGEGALVMCDQVMRIYSRAGIEVQALQGLDLRIEEGELVAMVGASGWGKSTLMSILVAGYSDGAPGPGGGSGSGRAEHSGAADLPAAASGLCVAACVAESAAVSDRAAERGDADAACRGRPAAPG